MSGRCIDGVAIPVHDYERSESSDEEEAELNNENLPKSASVDSLLAMPGDNGFSCPDAGEQMVRFSEQHAFDGVENNQARSPRVSVDTEENNLISHLQRSSSQSHLSSLENGRRSEETGTLRASGDGRTSSEQFRRSSEGRRSGSFTTRSSSDAKVRRELSESTLYLGNLHPYVTEVVLAGLFAGFEGIIELKVIKDRTTGMSAGYGFARFVDVKYAAVGLEHVENQVIYGQRIKASWALQKDKDDEFGSRHHVFVGDLSSEVTDAVLTAAFAHLEGSSDARVMWDHGSGRSKGYGFVSFVTEELAERAIEGMNGAYIGSQVVRCGWARHKTDAQAQADPDRLNQTDPTNTNVYIGNLPGDLSYDEAKAEFSKYGAIAEVKLHRKGNYGFVRYRLHEEAVDAIIGLNSGQSFGGRKLKCSWGRHPMTGVNAQLLAAAATSGHMNQPAVMHSTSTMMASPYMLPQPVMMPTNLSMMGNMGTTLMGAPFGTPFGTPMVPMVRQVSPAVPYALGQMHRTQPVSPLVLTMDGLGVDAVMENMAHMGLNPYGSQMAMPQSDVDHAMASGFYRPGSGGPRGGRDGRGRK